MFDHLFAGAKLQHTLPVRMLDIHQSLVKAQRHDTPLKPCSLTAKAPQTPSVADYVTQAFNVKIYRPILRGVCVVSGRPVGIDAPIR